MIARMRFPLSGVGVGVGAMLVALTVSAVPVAVAEPAAPGISKCPTRTITYWGGAFPYLKTFENCGAVVHDTAPGAELPPAGGEAQ